jgi:hypothetical protein
MGSDRTPNSDDGVTLIELLVYSLLLVVVVTVVGGLLTNMLRTQSSVTTVTGATTNGQLASNSIQAGIRNSSAFKLVANGTDQLLVAKTVLADSAATQVCVAWYYSSSEKSIRYTSLQSLFPMAVVPATTTWTSLSTGVAPVTGTAIFSRATPIDPSLNIAFTSSAGSTSVVKFSSSVVSRAVGTGISSCYSGT